MKTEKKNVLLLAVSTLPISKPMASVYKYEDKRTGKKYCFHGVSQMEAETKLVISLLEDQGEKLDRIVCLCTKEAREVEKRERYDVCGYSAMEFFRRRMLYFLNPESFSERLDPYNSFDEKRIAVKNCPEHILSKENYENLPDDFFKIVDMEQVDYFWDAVDAIRMDGRDSRIDLYLDMQGGERTAVAEINAIVQLLKSKRVEIKGRYVNDFHPGKQIHMITEVTDRYSKYDLATGLHVFRKYGWGTELQDYFDTYEKKQADAQEKPVIKKLLDAVNQASDGIRLCNMKEFDKALDHISGLHISETSREAVEEIIFQEIKADYGNLLEDHGPINKIKWCIRKGFYQQALTILESQMPSLLNAAVEISVEKIQCRKGKEGGYQDISDELFTVEESIRFQQDKDKMFRWMDRENYSFIIWSNPLIVRKRGEKEDLELDLNEDLKQQWKNEEEKILESLEVVFKSGELRWEKDGIQYKETLRFGLKEGIDRKRFGYFVVLHYALKDQRNAINHSKSGERIRVERIVDTLELYLLLAEKTLRMK